MRSCGIRALALMAGLTGWLALTDRPLALAEPAGAEVAPGAVAVEILEGIPDKSAWPAELPAVTERFDLPAFGIVCLPTKYNEKGVRGDRGQPFVVAATARLALPAGEHKVLLRSRNAARLLVDGKLVVETGFLVANTMSDEPVPVAPKPVDPRMAALAVGHQEQAAQYESDGQPHEFRLLAIVGGKGLRPEIGEVSVSTAQGEAIPRLLGPNGGPALTDEAWGEFVAAAAKRQQERDHENRRAAAAVDAEYWQTRHEIARREWARRPALEVPELARLDSVNNNVDRFINARLEAAGLAPAPLADDLAFLRRVTLDTVGMIPSRKEIEDFLADDSPERRARVIDRLLADPRWADHWVSYWQDVLAENPGILKPMLNNTGPFRWWIYESFLDDKPFDRFVTELVRMDGGRLAGGPAGFAMATDNDAPMASKAHIVAKGFLGVEMQCARCHDAPFHPFHQQDLFSVAAMLANGPQKVPPTSTVILKERSRRPLVQVTLEPGVPVSPDWPFAHLATADLPEGLALQADKPRERLAAIVTSPRNVRFAHVMLNRLWQRYLGTGLVDPVDDWNDVTPSHPELLDYLAGELVTHDYALKHVARLILNSHTYQRAVVTAAANAGENSPGKLFASPARRRMSAEQLVDSLFQAAGKPFGAEELTMDPEGRRPLSQMLNLGVPRRAWEFTSLSNERDRPALALPVAQSIVDVLTSYGWRESRQNPLTVREEFATPLQPMVLANGVAGNRVTRLSDDSSLTALALEERSLPQLVRDVFRQILSRDPSAEERQTFVALLSDGYENRRTAAALVEKPALARPRGAMAVSWANHLSPEATRIKMELERAAREGDPATNRLQPEWRERMEDMLWTLINSPEFAFVP